MKSSRFVFSLLHGRTDPDGGATTVDGKPIENWGFDGPKLRGCTGFHWTYGILQIFFADDKAFAVAQRATGWRSDSDYGLVVEYDGDVVRIFNKDRDRYEYFGDMDLHPEAE